MTEYTSSREAIREYMSSRDRTALWVRTHSPTRADFYSPSLLPSELPPTPTSPPSEVESSFSVPPKMVLKYKDGRPDIPISHWHYHEDDRSKGSGGRRHAHAGDSRHEQYPSHARSRSQGASIVSERDRMGRSGSRRAERPYDGPGRPLTPLTPEEIRVWPSDSDDFPRPLQPRSKSLPRDSHFREEAPPPLPTSGHTVPLQTMFPPLPRHAHAQPPPPHHSPSPRIVHPQPRPVAWHSIPQAPPPRPSRTPPAIVYAPSHHSKTHYSPPPIIPAHTHHGAGGMKYSHSAPVRYPNVGPAPFPLVRGPTPRSSMDESRGTEHSPERSETESDDSGSTYYVLPTPGQKVHIIVSVVHFSASLCVLIFFQGSRRLHLHCNIDN
jgi:hypothetical protein